MPHLTAGTTRRQNSRRIERRGGPVRFRRPRAPAAPCGHAARRRKDPGHAGKRCRPLGPAAGRRSKTHGRWPNPTAQFGHRLAGGSWPQAAHGRDDLERVRRPPPPALGQRAESPGGRLAGASTPLHPHWCCSPAAIDPIAAASSGKQRLRSYPRCCAFAPLQLCLRCGATPRRSTLTLPLQWGIGPSARTGFLQQPVRLAPSPRASRPNMSTIRRQMASGHCCRAQPQPCLVARPVFQALAHYCQLSPTATQWVPRGNTRRSTPPAHSSVPLHTTHPHTHPCSAQQPATRTPSCAQSIHAHHRTVLAQHWPGCKHTTDRAPATCRYSCRGWCQPLNPEADPRLEELQLSPPAHEDYAPSYADCRAAAKSSMIMQVQKPSKAHTHSTSFSLERVDALPCYHCCATCSICGHGIMWPRPRVCWMLSSWR